MFMLLLSVVAIALLAPFVLHVLRIFWGTDTLSETAYELAMRWVPSLTSTPVSLRRRLVRSVTSCVTVFPSGLSMAAGSLTVRISPEDVVRLSSGAGVAALEADLERVYQRHAVKQHWRIPPGGSRVVVEVSPGLRPGWIPNARSGRTDTSAAHSGANSPDGAPASIRVELTDSDGRTRSATSTGPELVIGRSPRCAVRASADVVSREHLVIRRSGAGWVARDLGSRNGTFEAGARLAAQVDRRLRDEQTLVLGSTGPRVRVSLVSSDEAVTQLEAR